MKKIVAMVLAGGAFSALGIMAGRRAKAAIPFGGMYRIIDFVLSNLMNSEVDYVGILAQYRPASLIDHIGGGASWDLYGRTRGIKILPPFKGETDSDWYRGTADAVYQNLNFIRDHHPSEVLILAGENVYSMNYQEVLNFHREKQADCTLVCNPLPTKNPHRFGIVSLDQDGRIATYHEKPETITGDFYSAGIYVFNAEFLLKKLTEDAANPESKHNFADDIIPAMLRAGDKFYGYPFRGYWAYCGTLEEYWQANMDSLDEHTALDLWKWNVRTNLDDSNVSGQHPALFLPTSKVKRALISPGCKIGGIVENSVLSPGVVVEEGAVIRDSIIMNGTVIRTGAVVNRAIIDKGAEIGAGANLGVEDATSGTTGFDLTLIGKEVTIGNHAQIGRNVLINHGRVIGPNQRIESGRIIQ
ncbi:nucleotidyl transferase [Candidatus Moduliflexus flocculans]|uniref:Nucleotidyl transferase n=1 Tax=Candidatus Moduliflexus flocculans TaxID=1499966 RepID=A0A0S6VZP1_9BACT|nr:nucleotidyl transferase [Candidatus Moduliflexus flocculans]